MPIRYHRSKTRSELEQILALQRKNMACNLPPTEVQEEGFITVEHSYEILEKMNNFCPHIIAKDGEKLIAYALVMLRSFRNEISVLRPMFDTADQLLPDRNYVAMGQICIAKAYRQKGVFKGLYDFYKKELGSQFECLITLIASNNKRSIDAHLAVGFQILDTQITDGDSWELVNWDWK